MVLALSILLGVSVLVNIVAVWNWLGWRNLAYQVKGHIEQLIPRLNTTFDLLWDSVKDRVKMDKNDFTRQVIEVSGMPRMVREKVLGDLFKTEAKSKSYIGF